MTSETKRANEQAAYQLGWMAYERGDNDSEPYDDETFTSLCAEHENHTELMTRAYNRGFDDAMYASMEG